MNIGTDKQEMSARKVTLGYVIAGIVWIVISNVFLALFSGTSQYTATPYIITELIAVTVTAAIFYVLTQRNSIAHRFSQQKLHDLEQHYATMMKQASDGIILIDQQGTILSANPRAQQLLGHSEEDLQRIQATSLIHMETADAHFLYFDDILQHKTLITERWIKRADSTLLPVEISVAPLDNQRAVAILRDISERKKMEEELRRKEQHYRALIENAFDVITIISGTGEILYNSPSIERVLGYQNDELIGHKTFSFLRSESVDAFHAVLKKVQEEPDSTHFFETQMRHKDGSWRIVEGSLKNAIHNPHIGGIIANTRDITTRKLAEQHLLLFQTAMEQASDAVVLLHIPTNDMPPYILYTNPACARITGYSPEDSVGQPLSAILHTTNGDAIVDAFARSLREQAPLSGETVLSQREALPLPVEWSITPLYTNDDNTITHATCILRDIAERKQAETDLLEAKERAEDMNKLKTALLATMNHEFRTPMNGILGFSDILEKELDNQEHKLFAHMIHISAERLMKTLTNILALARLAANSIPVHAIPIDLKTEVEDVLQQFRSIARDKGLRLYFDSISSDVVALADVSIVRELLTDLLSNAFKFTHEGSVTVQVFTDTHSDKLCAAVRVIDTGIGISHDFLPHIFDEFTQESSGVSRSYEGIGLGLTLVKRFLDLIGGGITVESEQGKGSIFTVYLPLRSHREEEIDSASLQETVPQDFSVLFLRSPMESTHLLIQHYLAPMVQLTIANNSDELLHCAQQQGYNLVLIDTIHQHLQDIAACVSGMRTVVGYEEIPVVALTDYTTNHEREYLTEAGCTALLSKPFSRRQLIESIARYAED